jgi:predicted nucleotidyltransferase
MIPFLAGEVEALRAAMDLWPSPQTVILGASALRCFMPMPWRLTDDLDLSVTTSIEDAALALARLPGWTRDPVQEQRWHTPAGIAVDVVPASRQALARGYIEWPRAGLRMSLLGMRLAFERGVDLRIAADLEVRVVPLHVLAVLKVVAYLDRPQIREKDLADLAHILHGYVGRDSHRRFSSEVPDELTEFEDVAPYLLGRDIGTVVNAEERDCLEGFVARVQDEALGPPLLARLARHGPPSWRDPDDVALRVLAFRRGLNDAFRSRT